MLLEDFLNNMSQLYQNKYRIPSSRLQHWDYRSDGAYFITSCTQNRKHYFGEIENIQNYIVNNPLNWGKDKFSSKK